MFESQMLNYNAVTAIDKQIEELKRQRAALAAGHCYIPLPSYESMINPYNLNISTSCPEPNVVEGSEKSKEQGYL